MYDSGVLAVVLSALVGGVLSMHSKHQSELMG